MTHVALATLMVILSGIGATFANAQVSVAGSSTSMNVCGKDIELGSLPKVVFDKFEGTGCIVYKVAGDPDFFAIAKGSAQIGTVKFAHGLLATISREWAADIKSSEEFARAVVNALQEVQAHGSSQCVLSTLNQADPSFEARGSVMKCGRRTLVFSVNAESGQQKFQIEEILGD
jgi:hypothetical protein